MVARAPRRRMYRTMQGRMVDIEKLRAANESVRAVGNMNVNARGDEIDSQGNIVRSREEIMQEYHKINSMVPTDDVIHDNVEEAKADDSNEDWSTLTNSITLIYAETIV